MAANCVQVTNLSYWENPSGFKNRRSVPHGNSSGNVAPFVAVPRLRGFLVPQNHADSAPHENRSYTVAHPTGVETRAHSAPGCPHPPAARFVRSGFNARSVRCAQTRVDFIGDEPNPDCMVKTKKTTHDPQWAKTKTVCRLNMEDIRMAKELGLSPQSLRKNRPSPSQSWKLPVKEWIHELYEKR